MPYFTHLTKNNYFENNNNALDNLRSILIAQTIYAKNPHGWFLWKTKAFTKLLASKFNSVCFTGLPLRKLGNLIDSKTNSKLEFKLAPYGISFQQKPLLKRGVQKVKHVHSGTWDAFKEKKSFQKAFSRG